MGLVFFLIRYACNFLKLYLSLEPGSNHLATDPSGPVVPVTFTVDTWSRPRGPRYERYLPSMALSSFYA